MAVVSFTHRRDAMTSSGPLRIGTDRLSLSVLPEAGGGVLAFDALVDGQPVPLMRPASFPLEDGAGLIDPNRLASYPLLPWSNRIAHGGFFHGEQWVPLARNRADDAWPIHGSGWQRPWTVLSHGPDSMVLALDEALPEAYAFRATMGYRIVGDTMRFTVRVINAGPRALPFGLGVHPFFPLHGGVRLHAPATSVWQNDGRDPLPVRRESVPPAWDFSEPADLPAGGLNHAFQGWNGHAVIEWPARALRLHIEADVDTYVIYVPEGEAFFCFEPVDHPINAVHLPGGAVANGMTELAPRSSLERAFAFRVERLDA